MEVREVKEDGDGSNVWVDKETWIKLEGLVSQVKHDMDMDLIKVRVGKSTIIRMLVNQAATEGIKVGPYQVGPSTLTETI
jgi:hypothetical protein